MKERKSAHSPRGELAERQVLLIKRELRKTSRIRWYSAAQHKPSKRAIGYSKTHVRE
jgi:hypothetical protein